MRLKPENVELVWKAFRYIPPKEGPKPIKVARASHNQFSVALKSHSSPWRKHREEYRNAHALLGDLPSEHLRALHEIGLQFIGNPADGDMTDQVLRREIEYSAGEIGGRYQLILDSYESLPENDRLRAKEKIYADLMKFGRGNADWNIFGVIRESRGAEVMRAAEDMAKGVCGVYIIRCESTGRYKIGKSIDVASRLKGHAKSLLGIGGYMPGPARVVRVIPCHKKRLALMELVAHWIYDEHRVGAEEIFGPDLGSLPKPEDLRSERDLMQLAVRLAEAMPEIDN